ncbi:hypothetical protein [Streptomyces sp. NPDC018584]|uniref:hypothetical protein n=1 Tax=unclassified Streptomyces TaxID=2593676 RepID=UPI0037AE2E5B
MSGLEEVTGLDEAAEEAMAELYHNGKYYTAQWLRENALKAQPGPNPVRKIVVDLGVGDSVDRLDSTKGQRLYGPQSVEVTFWTDGGIDQKCFELGRAPAPPRNTHDGRYIDPNAKPKGRKVGEYYDKDVFEWNGTSKTAREWYDHPDRVEGLSLSTFKDRLKKQRMGVHEALTKPPTRGGRRVPRQS